MLLSSVRTCPDSAVTCSTTPKSSARAATKLTSRYDLFCSSCLSMTLSCAFVMLLQVSCSLCLHVLCCSKKLCINLVAAN